MKYYGNSLELTPEMHKILSLGESFWLIVTGNSMAPTFNDLLDKVYISPFNGNPKKGDILLTEANSKHCLLHRVVKIDKDMVFYKGDALPYREGPFPISNVIGIVTKIERSGKIISVSSLYNKLYLTALRKTTKLRNFPHRIVRKLKRIFK